MHIAPVHDNSIGKTHVLRMPFIFLTMPPLCSIPVGLGCYSPACHVNCRERLRDRRATVEIRSQACRHLSRAAIAGLLHKGGDPAGGTRHVNPLFLLYSASTAGPVVQAPLYTVQTTADQARVACQLHVIWCTLREDGHSFSAWNDHWGCELP
jgi:hypothetical protein